MENLKKGFWSGILATSAMTIAMFAMQRKKGAPLPPAQLTEDLVPDMIEPSSSEGRSHLTMIAHFGFGITMATAYALWSSSRKKRTINSVSRGSLFGLLVWTGSYLGWIPALGLRPAAKRLSLSQNLMMIANHLIWGAALGYCEKSLRKPGRNLLDGKAIATGR